MPKYSYTALDLQSRKHKGITEARDETDLKNILRGMELVPTSFKIMENKEGGYKLKANESAEFSRQLANMLGSGITVARAMEILKERDFKPQIKSVYEKLYKDVQQGYTLSEAMRMQKSAYPDLLMNMYASGEASGQLEQVAGKMAVHYEKEHRLNGKVKGAMIYPMILLVAVVLVILAIFLFILPIFTDMFADMEMPALTAFMFAVSGFVRVHWYVLIIIAVALFILITFLKTIDAFNLAMDRNKLRMPVIGKLLRVIYTARFARTLCSLYTSGISMITALEISSTIIGNRYIEGQFVEVIKNVRNGEPLSEAVKSVDGFDKKLSASILIGEESGRLDAMLESTADSFDYEAEIATGQMVQLLEPIMIVVMAIIIGIVMVSVIMPMMSVYENYGSSV